ncbi:uracil-DNA glycosylase [Roseateles sp.]|uniref:uracil-DNA glycosylase n=1 Tax=Roseateles sp. TaxID=1971397 RepID=UPI0026856DD7
MSAPWDERQRAMLAEMGLRLPPAPRAPLIEAEAPPLPSPSVVSAPPPLMGVPARAPSSPSGFEGLSLPALREAVSACRGCGLCEQRRQAVFGAGALQQAQWLVVTDPVDEADDGAGEALSGDAGRLLDRMLAAAGQSRTGSAPTAFVTPIVKCRPPRGRAPQPAELEACEAVLAAQVALLQPRLVLALGLQAARRLTGLAEPLGRLRGRLHRWRELPLVVTYHPAYLLRSPADKAGAWDDLCLARRALHSA